MLEVISKARECDDFEREFKLFIQFFRSAQDP